MHVFNLSTHSICEVNMGISYSMTCLGVTINLVHHILKPLFFKAVTKISEVRAHGLRHRSSVITGHVSYKVHAMSLNNSLFNVDDIFLFTHDRFHTIMTEIQP